MFPQSAREVQFRNVTRMIGQHTFRAGMFYQWDNNPQVAPFINTNGTINEYYVGETFTDPVQRTLHSTGALGSGNGGNYLADFAEGIVFQYNQTNIMPEPNLYFWNLAGDAQDHWRLTKRLSIDYGLRIDRSRIFSAAWSYDFGSLVKQRFIGGITNGWQLSGIVQYQTGPNLPSIISSNFGIGGSLAVPVGAVAAVSANNSSTCATTSGAGTCTQSVSNTSILGTPDVNLQPRVVAIRPSTAVPISM